jgi:hypothetical protein
MLSVYGHDPLVAFLCVVAALIVIALVIAGIAAAVLSNIISQEEWYD